MQQGRIKASLTIAALALTALLIITVLPRASTAAPRLERQPLESLTGLNSAEATERDAPLSAFGAPSTASVVQSPGTTTADAFVAKLAVGGGLPPPSFGPSIKVNDDMGIANQESPAIAVDTSGNAHAVWTDYRTGNREIYYAKMQNGSSTWSANIKAGDVSTATEGAVDHDVDITVDDEGNVHIVWIDWSNYYETNKFQLLYSRLPAGSTNWTTPVKVNTVPEVAGTQPAIAVAQGTAHVTWIGGDEDGHWDGIYYSKLAAGSDTWNASVKISNLSGDCRWTCNSDIAIDAFGNVHVVWADWAAGILYTQLPAGSDNWDNIIRVDDQGVTPWQPSLAVDTLGNLYVLWIADGYPWQVYYSTLYPGGTTWSAAVKLSEGNINNVYPVIAVDRDGNVHAAWRSGSYAIVYAELPSGSASWSEMVRVNDQEQGVMVSHPAIAAHSEESVYVIWDDDRNKVWDGSAYTNLDIYSAKTGRGAPMPFLDLPFDYGDSVPTFVQSLRDTDDGGRVNSWFDHKYPDGFKNQQLVLYDGRARTKNLYNPNLGCYEGRCYDGHNGIDFARLLDDPQNLPIRPAASGVVTEITTACTDSCRYGSCSSCGAYGNYVIVDHQNGYFTRYAHLQAVYVSQGQTVTTNDTLGIMGSTGHTFLGTHLHFGVYRDNGNGQWDGESVDKPVDPYGWKGAEADPWVADHQGPTSHYLWIHPLSNEESVSGDQGATMTDTTGHIQVSIPPGAFSGQATLELSPVPEAEPSTQLRSTGRSFWLRLLEWVLGGDGLQSATALQSTTQFTLTKPITLTVTYTDTDVLHLDVSQLALHHWNEEQETWQPLTTTVDPVNHVVTAQTEDLGDFDLQAPLLCTTDDLELDDGYAAARWVWPNDWPLARGLDIPQDSDWVRFDAVQGVTYTIGTHNLAGGADTVLNLYDVDALTLLTSNDDAGGGPASELVWTAPYTGTFFVETVSASGGTTDCSATYELTIATIPGDVVADCWVDIADIMAVASQWRCKRGDACYNTLYDLDKDGDIDIVDIMLVVAHWGETCE